MTTKKMLIWLAAIAVVATALWFGVAAIAPGPEDYGALAPPFMEA
jgi:hypothetical protein